MNAAPGAAARPVAPHTSEPTPSPNLFVGRRLRIIGILLPVAGAIALEVLRYILESRGMWSPDLMEVWHVTIVLVVIGGIIIFGVLMFRLIDRSERQVLSQNRDLTTANAVAGAIQGKSTVDSIVEGSLTALLRSSGATQVAIRVFGPGDLPSDESSDHTLVLPGSKLSGDSPSLDVALTNGATTVGRLSIWYADSTDLVDRVGSTALSSLTTQIACAIQLGQAVGDLNRRKEEGHALYDILLRVSNQDPTTPVLDTVARHAITLLHAEGASITVYPETARSVRFEAGPDAPTLALDGSAVVARGEPKQTWVHSASRVGEGAAGPLCEIVVGRTSGNPFSERDRGFLSTLASLVGIALSGAQMREGARQRATLNERTRIAREMHDSLAQVLGAVHLRLRALDATMGSLPQEQVAAEVDDLAEVCAEAYRDVREAILGLRDAQNHADRSLEDNLGAYLAKYSAQSGIAAVLNNEVGHTVTLSPRSEVHIIRVVQEALTNVRKHAEASAVTVTIRGSDTTTTFAIEDDGVGFDPAAMAGSQDGYGLFTMRDRAALLGGSVDIDSAVGRGTRVTVTVPERSVPPRPLRSDQ